MDDFLLSLIGGASGGLGAYLLVFGILVICGLGVPMPEDISLILGGFLAFQGKADLSIMMLVGYLGILVGDSIIFFAGRRIGSKVGQSPNGLIGRVITPEKRARVETLFKRQGEKIVMLARFMPGVRTVTYFTAGSVGMRYVRFALFDSLAALVSAPVFVYLGFRFGGELDWLFEQIKNGQRTVLLVLVAVGLIGFLVYRWRSRREKRLNAEALRSTVAAEAPARTDA